MQPAVAAPQRTPAATVLSNAFFRLARFDLRAQAEPISADYRLAAILIERAEKYRPQDAELVRRRIEANWAAGDSTRMLEATERLIKLDPADTVALLRLIGARINSIQTVEDRLAAYGQFLGSRGESLDPSVRSRLALDASLLCRERGDDDGFVKYLKLANQLDGTNKDAALLAYTYLSERLDDPVARFELLVNLLYADPLDPRVHTMIRDALAAERAFSDARRFHKISRDILVAAQSADRGGASDSLVLDWHVDGPETPLTSIVDQLEQQRAVTVYQDNLRREAGITEPGAAPVNPDDVRLDLEFERIRLAAADAAGKPESVESGLIDFSRSIDAYVTTLADPQQRGQMTQEQADSIAASLRIDLALWRLLVNRPAENAEPIATPETAPTESVGDAHAAVGWAHLRAGRLDEAAAAFESASEFNLWRILGMGEVAAARGDKAEAIRVFESAVDIAPLSPLGGWASSRAKALRGGPRPMTAAGRAMQAEAQRVPAFVDVMAARPGTFQQLSVDLVEMRSPPLGRAEVRIRVRNIAPIPLALGTDRTINTRIVLSPNLELIDRGMQALATAEVVELDRRLRLRTGEAVEVVTWADAGLTGWLTELASTAPSRMRWRGLQGFEAGVQGQSQRPGPGSLESSTATHLRLPLPESHLAVADLIQQLETASGDDLIAAIAAVRTKMLFDVAGGDDAAAARVRTELAEAVARLYPAWPVAVRTAAAAMLPSSRSAPEAAPIDAALRAETEAEPLFAVVVTRPTTVDDPSIVAALASDDPLLRELAGIQRSRIAAGRPTLATSGASGGDAAGPAR